MVAVEIVEQVLQGLDGRDGALPHSTGFVVGLPLVHMQLLFGEFGIAAELAAHVVEALEGAHAGGAHGNGTGLMGKQLGNGLAAHADVFGVHLVTLYLLALDGLERAGAHMERDLLAVDAAAVDGLQHLGGEMQSGRWCGHRTLHL